MVVAPENWQWSSFLVTIGKQEGFKGLATNAVLFQFGIQRSQAIGHNLKHQIYLGNDNLVENFMKHLTYYEGKLSEIPQKQRQIPLKV